MRDPKPPMTPGTVTDDVSKKLHHKMYVTTNENSYCWGSPLEQLTPLEDIVLSYNWGLPLIEGIGEGISSDSFPQGARKQYVQVHVYCFSKGINLSMDKLRVGLYLPVRGDTVMSIGLVCIFLFYFEVRFLSYHFLFRVAPASSLVSGNLTFPQCVLPLL